MTGSSTGRGSYQCKIIFYDVKVFLQRYGNYHLTLSVVSFANERNDMRITFGV